MENKLKERQKVWVISNLEILEGEYVSTDQKWLYIKKLDGSVTGYSKDIVYESYQGASDKLIGDLRLLVNRKLVEIISNLKTKEV